MLVVRNRTDKVICHKKDNGFLNDYSQWGLWKYAL